MKIRWLFLLLIVPFSCKEKYMPDVHVPATGFLVVEGFINVGAGSTLITLTRASGLDSIAKIPETGAQLEVESESGAAYPLMDMGGGNYLIDQVPAEAGERYRLHISRNNGKEYYSDYSAYKTTPEIDSINWKASSDQVSIYANTHDITGQSLYYQWRYEETWEYNSRYTSYYKYVSPKFVLREPGEIFYYCWSSDISTNILIGSSSKLQSDVIFESLLTTIPLKTTNKLVSRYSILVRQYAISKDWYEWTQKIKKNTEQLGSIFDAQPSETGGNIHSKTDPAEPVIGFVGCTTETSKRIFIDRNQIPPGYVYTGYESCTLDTFPPKSSHPPTVDEYFSRPSIIPVDFLPGFGNWDMVTTSGIGCVDCREHGGTEIKPDFW